MSSGEEPLLCDSYGDIFPGDQQGRMSESGEPKESQIKSTGIGSQHQATSIVCLTHLSGPESKQFALKIGFI
jgi:hypothetical protein